MTTMIEFFEPLDTLPKPDKLVEKMITLISDCDLVERRGSHKERLEKYQQLENTISYWLDSKFLTALPKHVTIVTNLRKAVKANILNSDMEIAYTGVANDNMATKQALFDRVVTPVNYTFVKANVSNLGLSPKRLSLDEENKDHAISAVQTIKVYKNTVLALECRDAIQLPAKTTGPYSERRKNLWIGQTFINALEGARTTRATTHPDYITADLVAREAIRCVRQCLPLGPLNNLGSKGMLDRPASWSVNPAYHFSQVEGLAADLTVKVCGSSYDFLASLAAQAAAAKAIGAGVCTFISALTAGFLTMLAPPGSEILLVYHAADHQYVVLSCNKCQWFVVDPWVQNSFFLDWSDCCFPATGGGSDQINNYFKIIVHQSVDIPYGIKELVDNASINASKGNLTFAKTTSNMSHLFGHCCNLKECDIRDADENYIPKNKSCRLFADKIVASKQAWGGTYSTERKNALMAKAVNLLVAKKTVAEVKLACKTDHYFQYIEGQIDQVKDLLDYIKAEAIKGTTWQNIWTAQAHVVVKRYWHELQSVFKAMFDTNKPPNVR